ncbi:MAG TPA: glutamate-1-semialdehyde 2,1-aminomutase [Dehalococcoidia bacterium]|nr:glutamate-1-semialdehyde 2,1-aminomutase [Dehalococcoidia bacterium]
MANTTAQPHTLSRTAFARAQTLFPGGVNSPVRAFRAVGGEPPVIARAAGCRVYDLDGNGYIDYVGAYGPLILGHAHAAVVAAIQRAAADGASYGMPTRLENELGALVREAFPTIELLRFVSSGTEATMSALRVARGFTGRDKIVKFAGCYHGHSDQLLAQAGSGIATLGLPGSAGVPAAAVSETLIAPFNNLAAVEAQFAAWPGQIAAVIVEPVPANMGVVPPAPGYLEGLRAITRRESALLIFDEVITGFRVAYGGAQARYGIEPDLTCLGKIVGGGLPVGVYGGRREIMEVVAPLGPVYQAGTLSGNPLAMAAGCATLHELQKPGVYERLEELGARLGRGLESACRARGVPATLHRVGSILTGFFTAGPVQDYASAQTADTARYARVHTALLERGVFLAPSQFEAAFVSLAHGEAEIDATIAAFTEALAA